MKITCEDCKEDTPVILKCDNCSCYTCSKHSHDEDICETCFKENDLKDTKNG